MIAFFALLVVPLGFAYAAPANPPPPGDMCSTYTSGNSPESAYCPEIYATASALYYAALSLNGEEADAFSDVNKIVAQLIPSSDPVADLTASLTTAFVGNVVQDISGNLQAFAGTLQNTSPQCKCDLSNCNNALGVARSNCQAGQTTAKQACTQAQYNCAPYYSTSQIDSYVPCCAQYS